MTITSIGHPILGVRAGWELFALDGNGVVAVQFSRGRIIRTTVPRLLSDGPVSFVAARGEAIIRPLDNVPGYLVRDGQPAQPLTGVLAQGGTLLPGPTLAQQWLDSGTLMLVGPRGTPEPVRLPIPAYLRAPNQAAIADGRGGLLLAGPATAVVYDATPGLLRPIRAGLLAVGPRDWLGMTCDMDCHLEVIGAATGISRVLPVLSSDGGPWPWQALPGGLWPSRALPGIVSPDGSTAALIVPNVTAGQQAWLELVSLTSGDAERVTLPVAPGNPSQSLAWSPDSRWLFVVTANGTLAAVDARTGRAQTVGLGMTGLSQIAIRPAG